MNALKQTWRQLVRRRLWPVALLLVAALVAVPVVLAKPATPAPAEPVAAANAATATTPAESYVQLASDDATTKGKAPRVLGAKKDPFEPAALPKVKHAKKKAAKATATATATAAATASPASPAATTAPSAGPAPAATTTPAPVKHHPANSVQVRFGKTTGTDSMKKLSLTRLETLPSASSPLAVFMGFAHGGKDAVFMLTGTVTAEGDGSCDPSPASCETLLLRKGQTEFLTFAGTKADGEYELDVNDIHATKSASASALVAKATPAATATAAATATP